MLATVYDWFGNHRVTVDLRPGDGIEYKRGGVRGLISGTFLREANGRAVVALADGSEVRLTAHCSIMTAFRDGNRLGTPVDPVREVTIKEVEAPSAKWGGHVSARDALGRECYWNAAAPGWPVNLPTIGEVWRVEARLQKFGGTAQSGAWFFLERVSGPAAG